MTLRSDLRTCRVCGDEKPLSAYYAKGVGRTDTQCIACRLDYERNRYYENRDRLLADKRESYAFGAAAMRLRIRANYEKHIEKRRAADRARSPKRYAALDRQKANARQRVAKAVQEGRMARPVVCEQCGCVSLAGRIHAHHADYGRPLDVRWLCVACHGQEHRSVA